MLFTQALRFDFKIASASESNADFRMFLKENHPDSMQHMFESVELQTETKLSAPCLICASQGHDVKYCSGGRKACRGCDLMIAGSPCNPFSVYRAKRFSSGNVKNHVSFSVTMGSIIDMFQLFEPHVAVLEQVMGFLYPIDTTTSATPYDRPGCQIAHVVSRKSKSECCYIVCSGQLSRLSCLAGFAGFLGRSWCCVVQDSNPTTLRLASSRPCLPAACS